MGEENICDAGLALGLSLIAWESPASAASPRTKEAAARSPSSPPPEADDAYKLSTIQHSSRLSFIGKRDKDGSSEEEEVGNTKKKLRLNKDQSALLEAMFKEHNTLSPTQKQSLARKLNLRPRQVEVWFQNRRARTKLKQTEMDCAHLRKYCQRLAEENSRLKRELQDLRAMRSFVRLPPPATLTLCQACETKNGGNTAKGGAGVPLRQGAQFCGLPVISSVLKRER
ncbi:homeobox-leucine zipper protein HAT4-like [Wolffia australiana]